MPPLMLTPDEIEAAVLGAQWVAGHADPALARAAAGPDRENRRHRARTAAAVRARARQPRPPGLEREPDRIDMARTRAQIHAGKKITLRYRDEHGRDSERTIWPIAIGYLEAVRHSGGMVRAAQGFSQLSHRPGRRRGLSRRKISGAARRAAGEMAPEPGLGAAERTPERGARGTGVSATAIPR